MPGRDSFSERALCRAAFGSDWTKGGTVNKQRRNLARAVLNGKNWKTLNEEQRNALAKAMIKPVATKRGRGHEHHDERKEGNPCCNARPVKRKAKRKAKQQPVDISTLTFSDDAKALLTATRTTCGVDMTCPFCIKDGRRIASRTSDGHLFYINKVGRKFVFGYLVGCSHVGWDGEPWCSGCVTLVRQPSTGKVEMSCSHCAHVDWARVTRQDITPRDGWEFVSHELMQQYRSKYVNPPAGN